MPFVSLPFPQLTLQALLRHKLGCRELWELSSVFFPGNCVGSLLSPDPQPVGVGVSCSALPGDLPFFVSSRHQVKALSFVAIL